MTNQKKFHAPLVLAPMIQKFVFNQKTLYAATGYYQQKMGVGIQQNHCFSAIIAVIEATDHPVRTKPLLYQQNSSIENGGVSSAG